MTREQLTDWKAKLVEHLHRMHSKWIGGAPVNPLEAAFMGTICQLHAVACRELEGLENGILSAAVRSKVSTAVLTLMHIDDMSVDTKHRIDSALSLLSDVLSKGGGA